MTAAAAAGLWLGLDVGASKLLGCAVDEAGRTVASRKAETRRDEGPEGVLARVLDVCRALLDEAGPEKRKLRGCGVGFAGLVSAGRVLSSIMLPGWTDFPLAERLESALGVPVTVDNDATAAGVGELEALGTPRGLNMVLLTIGTGIGGALVLDGRPYRGTRGLAGEIGNTSIDWHGPLCWCGSRGCLNTLASGSAIAARAGRPDVESVARAAAAGDRSARDALEAGAEALGAGVANLINLLDPDRVVLAGGVAELGEPWLERVRAAALARALPQSAEHVRIARSVRGYDVGAFGAACLARRAFGGAG